jgi:CHASE1-domain containing sensor protein
MAITRNAALAARAPGPRLMSTSIRSAVIMTALAQVLGLVMTVVGVWWQQRDIEGAAQVRFDRAVDRVEAEVLRRLEFPVFGLTGIRAAYAASDSVTRTEFRNLVQTLDIERQFPGVRGFGYIERIARVDANAYAER